MEFIPIFAGPNPKLYAVVYDGEKKDAFWKLFDQWQDPEFLFGFFTEHESDLQCGFYNCSTMEAVRITKVEATEFRDLIIETKDNGQIEDTGKIYELFKLLSNSDYRLRNLRKHKAYGPDADSWLRIYAIRVQDCFLITGGAIKLTKRMDERPHTQIELKKLERVKNELKSQGIFDQEGLAE